MMAINSSSEAILRDLANKLIVQVRRCDSRRLRSQHRVAEDVAADRLSGILRDEPAERAALLEDVLPLIDRRWRHRT
jgi:hypothetical protein